MGMKQPYHIKTQIFGNLSKSATKMTKMDKLLFQSRTQSGTLPLSVKQNLQVPASTVATFSASSFSANSAWRLQKANYGLLGSSVDPYSKLKVEWMKDLAFNSLNGKSSTLLLAAAQPASTMALSSSLV